MRSFIVTLVVTASAFAQAGEFHDSLTDLRLNVDVDGATACVLKPDAMRVTAGCNGINVAAAAPTVPPATRMMEIVRGGPIGAAIVSVNVQPKPGKGAMTKKDARDYVAGSVEQAKTQLGSAALKGEVETFVQNGVQIFGYTYEVPAAASNGLGTWIQYVLVGKEHLVTLQLMTDAAHAAVVTAVAKKMIATAKLPGSSSSSWK